LVTTKRRFWSLGGEKADLDMLYTIAIPWKRAKWEPVAKADFREAMRPKRQYVARVVRQYVAARPFDKNKTALCCSSRRLVVLNWR
jgi:hypothetical protein